MSDVCLHFPRHQNCPSVAPNPRLERTRAATKEARSGSEEGAHKPTSAGGLLGGLKRFGLNIAPPEQDGGA